MRTGAQRAAAPGHEADRSASVVPAPPAPLTSGGVYRICCVCWGNICRSPMAEVLLRSRVGEVGLAPRVRVDSAGTSAEELGRPVYPGTRRVLAAHGLDAGPHRAREFQQSWIGSYDLLLAMDAGHERTLRRYAGAAGTDPDRVRLVTSFRPRGSGFDGGIDDPWGYPDAAFEEVFALLQRCFDALVPGLARLLE